MPDKNVCSSWCEIFIFHQSLYRIGSSCFYWALVLNILTLSGRKIVAINVFDSITITIFLVIVYHCFAFYFYIFFLLAYFVIVRQSQLKNINVNNSKIHRASSIPGWKAQNLSPFLLDDFVNRSIYIELCLRQFSYSLIFFKITRKSVFPAFCLYCTARLAKKLSSDDNSFV